MPACGEMGGVWSERHFSVRVWKVKQMCVYVCPCECVCVFVERLGPVFVSLHLWSDWDVCGVCLWRDRGLFGAIDV